MPERKEVLRKKRSTKNIASKKIAGSADHTTGKFLGSFQPRLTELNYLPKGTNIGKVDGIVNNGEPSAAVLPLKTMNV